MQAQSPPSSRASPAAKKRQELTDQKEMLETLSKVPMKDLEKVCREHDFTGFSESLTKLTGLKKRAEVEVMPSRGRIQGLRVLAQGLPPLHTHSEANFLLSKRERNPSHLPSTSPLFTCH